MKVATYFLLTCFGLSANALLLNFTVQPLVERTFFELQTRQDQVAPASSKISIDSVHDLLYLAEINIAGTDFMVHLDTGSSDLWVKGKENPLPNTQPSDLYRNLTYLKGYAFGRISHAPVEFAGFKVPSQAFIDVQSANNSALSYNSNGIVGLGFTRDSVVDNAVSDTNVLKGHSLLYNIFNLYPEEPNFIAFALQRDKDGGDEVDGSFSIGEFDPDYSSIAGNKPIPTFPIEDPGRWTVLMDAVLVNGEKIIPTTKVLGAPDNKAVVLLDTGASYIICPPEIAAAIYSRVPNARFEESSGLWRMPCDTELEVALQIGGQVFPMHPLDVVTVAALDTSRTKCFGAFVPGDTPDDFDLLIGASFLRSTYSLYDFGDFDSNRKMGDPYVKLLSIIDPDKASVAFKNARGGSGPKTNITYIGLNGAEIDPVFTISKDISSSLELIGTLVPIMLGVVALNALVVIVAGIWWIVSLCKKRRRRRTMREPRGRATPIVLGSSRNSYLAQNGGSHQSYMEQGNGEDGGTPPVPHFYEPVSMAFTEDTFVPPSPAFLDRKGGGMSGSRPNSVA